MNSHVVKRLRNAIGSALLVGAPLVALAQTAPDSSKPANDEPVVLSQVVVTTSYLPDFANTATKPVQVIGPEEIANAGVTTDVADSLRKVMPQFTGNGSLGLENAGSEAFVTQGGSMLQIHNLKTLVLINGRRVAFDPAEAALGVEFVDLNMIPASAIDHIEIVSDGASALYGSDAVGGVINVILKSKFNGWEAGIHWGESSNPGHYTERTAYLAGGVSTKTTSLMVAVEGTETSPVYMNQRPYSNPIYTTTTYPGIVSVQPFAIAFDPETGQPVTQPGALAYYRLNTTLNAPPAGLQYSIDQLVQMGVYQPVTAQQLQTGYNVADKQTLLASFKRRSVMADFEHRIFDDRLVVFGNLLYGFTRAESSVAGQSLSPYISAPFTDPFIYGSSPPPAGAGAYVPYLPYLQPNSPFSPNWLFQLNPGGYVVNLVNANNLFAQYPILTQDQSEFYRFAGGLRGKLESNYNWEIGVNFNRYTLGVANPGQINTANLNAALAAGTINPFAYNQAAGSLPGNIIGTKTDRMMSTLGSVDFLFRGTPLELPNGKLSFAIGASRTRETLKSTPDAVSQPIAPGLSIAGWLNSQSLSPFEADRSFTSVYGELRAPIIGPRQNLTGIHELTIDLAGRYDNYSQVGHSAVPEASLHYEPIDERFTLRASIGRSFGAPELAELFGPPISGPIPPFNYQGYYGNTASSAGFSGISGPNPALQPFKANTWSTGFVLAPREVRGLDVSFDFFDTTVKGAIGYLNQVAIVQSVESLGPSSPFAQYVHVGSPTGPGVTGPGQLSTANPTTIFVQVPLINLTSQADKGFDLTIDYAATTQSAGRFKFSTTATVWNSYLLQEIPTEDYFQYAGTASGGGSSSQGTIPRWRTYTTLDWKQDTFEVQIGHTYIPSVDDIGPGGSAATAPVRVGDFQQFDVMVAANLGKALAAGWRGKTELRFGINNVFNRMPPVARNAFPATNADVGDYNGPIGRLYYAEVKFRY
ncbi:MAG TPA: TonB-dependent receptor plug domain-containing protein [Opitutaceae bacterium]|nr:TonB-dependent receptor plug domain-containing protein [Opitutaceae bacterium]